MKKIGMTKGFAFALIMVGVLHWGGCALIENASGLSLARELEKRGEKAEATIVQIWDTGTTLNNDPVIGFLLEVRRPGQAPYQARTKLVISRIRVATVQPGAIVPVRVDPADPRRVSLDIYVFAKPEPEKIKE